MARAGDQYKLFDTTLNLPNGFVYRPEFLTIREEEKLVRTFSRLTLVNAPFQEYTAKRRIHNFGWDFDYEANDFLPGPDLPLFLKPLQRRVAKWLDIPVTRVAEALITEYRPGTPIGWHRDREAFESVVGVSLAGWCNMRLRPMRVTDPKAVLSIPLEPRSAYLLQNESRWKWQHSIPETKALRYSITFRTLPGHIPTPVYR
jgi:alkylated DNA repair dioxygenase AlkB